MSYASVVAAGAPPLSAQPHPDTALLNTEQGETQLSSADSKITVAPADFKKNPRSADTDIRDELDVASEDIEEGEDTSRPSKGESRKDHTNCKKAGEECRELWEKAKGYLLRPTVAGGLLGVVNVGLLGSIGHSLYTVPAHRSSPRFLSLAAITTLGLFGIEGALAEAYRKTELGRREEARAKEEGAAICRHVKTVLLRPGVLGGYWSYVNWDDPWKWDRQRVSAASVGLLALFAGEG
ncbi:uncharacterized protein EI90DRAFT_3145387 [Cantharellus anzutake]|uniref:uncharacterized protein n=1 Tax=Cantharellus anzutake TaxID=1750568 RepID=UPI001905DA32|nr:uncharacterized protein EI90DRAFT_3145387 [Cantharellus anzutake]KAF8332716.1 hypothetical protein EI90DRAFT_3145387 [Cantharellus anzutake]